jgi:DNA mismatch repair protein MutS
LFAEAAPAGVAAASGALGGRSRFAAADASGDDSEALDADHLLEADAASRPRQRRDTAARARGQEGEDESDGAAAAATTKAGAGAAGASTKAAAGSALAETQPEDSTSPPAGPGESSNPADEQHPQPDADLPRWHHHSLVDPAALTPVLRHYVELKADQPERVLLYRLGDFFECFFEDAILLSRLLELTLTGKDAGKSMGRVPMAGLPHHAAERYCAELVRRGYSVALCDQLETTPAKGALLRRDITRVLTPGTVLE